MILVNRNFGNPVLSSVIGDMFKASSDDNMNIDSSMNITDVLASDSTLVSTIQNFIKTKMNPNVFSPVQQAAVANEAFNGYKSLNINPKNFYIVTEQFLRVLDKVYTKLWNESFTETGIYTPSKLITIYKGFVSDCSKGENSTYNYYDLLGEGTSYPQYPSLETKINIMLFKKFIDRCITAGILDETDRLDYQDQISLNDLNKIYLSTQIDSTNNFISMIMNNPITIEPNIVAGEGTYLYGKKLFLMFVPYLSNYNTITNTAKQHLDKEPTESFVAFGSTYSTINTSEYALPVRRPYAFFKPKTDASKFGRSLPLATHLIWSIGTPEDKELALLEGKPVPDLIFDHLDRISHIDSLTLKIKFDKLSF